VLGGTLTQEQLKLERKPGLEGQGITPEDENFSDQKTISKVWILERARWIRSLYLKNERMPIQQPGIWVLLYVYIGSAR
jgi:hypothetical protein